METIKLKTLVKKFSYNEIIEECDKQGWRLPTLAEVRGIPLDHQIVWVSDKPTDAADLESHNRFFDAKFPDVEFIANKHFRFNIVVVAKDKVCSNCVHLFRGYHCEIYDFGILDVIGVQTNAFGCTTNFKLRR